MSDEAEAARFLALHPELGSVIFQDQDPQDDLQQVFDDLHLFSDEGPRE